jgi:UDP-glucose 4-epimerase
VATAKATTSERCKLEGTILVLGGAGYIGSHMAKFLRERGEEHLVFDNLEQGHQRAACDSPFVRGDLREPDHLRRVFTAFPIDVVMHFAAYISVGESVREPAKYWNNNTVGVYTLLEEMRRAKIDKFVFSSTAAIFGEPEYVPIDEDHPKNPTNPYGDTKLAVERMLHSYDVGYGRHSVALRYFNAAGADPDGDLGEDHHPEEHIVPVAIEAALGKRSGLKIFGADYDTPDGTCVRDYIHVFDLAQAHLLAVRHLREGGDSRRYNLGNGNGFSVRQVIETVERVVGNEIPKEEAPRRPGDPATLIASSERIRKDWGWTPEYPDLETMVRHAWDWRRANPDGYASS